MKIARALGLFLFLFLFLTGLSVSAYAQDVKTDYDHKANFERYHTYSWGKVQTHNPLWVNRIKEAVDKELQRKGWQEVPSGGDVVITAVGSSETQQEYQTFYDGLGGWRWGGFGESTTTPVTYKVGTLVLDMYDAKNKQLIFRGTSEDTLAKNENKNEKKLEKAVEKMFKKFPPEEKG